VHTCIHTYIHTRATLPHPKFCNLYACIHTYTAYIYIHTYIQRLHFHTHTCTIYMHVYIHIQHTYIYIHTKATLPHPKFYNLYAWEGSSHSKKVRYMHAMHLRMYSNVCCHTHTCTHITSTMYMHGRFIA
jgi:hypothetical protein